MRPAEVTAVLLLVGTMFMSDSAASPTTFLDRFCKDLPKCEGIHDEGWFRLGEGRCLKAFHTSYKNFDDAEKACNQISSPNKKTAHLVSIHSKEELDQVVCAMYKVTPRRPPYWIGLHLTFFFEDNLIYDWTDGTKHRFDHFARHQPNFYKQEEKCIETNYRYWGRWNDVNCAFIRPYVCAVEV